jgi:hypothetical protein
MMPKPVTMGRVGSFEGRQLKYNLSIVDYDRVEELKARISYIRSAMGLENEEIW